MSAYGYLSDEWRRLYNAFPCVHGIPLAEECGECETDAVCSSVAKLVKHACPADEQDLYSGAEAKRPRVASNYRGRDTEEVTSMPHKITTTFTRDLIGWGGRGFQASRWTAWREETVIGEWQSRGRGWVFRDDGSRDVRLWRFNDWKRACRNA